MIIKITAQWGATPYFDAGEIQFELDWENHMIPLVGNVIRLASFIQDAGILVKTFTYNGVTTDVFTYIEDDQQWKVQQIEWERNEDGFKGHILVTDSFEPE